MLARAESYPPTQRGFDRLRRLGLLRNLDPAEVAAAVLSGVIGGRSHVRLPRRAALTGAVAEAPQRLVDAVMPRGPHR
jgi:hypothetical protein